MDRYSRSGLSSVLGTTKTFRTTFATSSQPEFRSQRKRTVLARNLNLLIKRANMSRKRKRSESLQIVESEKDEESAAEEVESDLEPVEDDARYGRYHPRGTRSRPLCL